MQTIVLIHGSCPHTSHWESAASCRDRGGKSGEKRRQLAEESDEEKRRLKDKCLSGLKQNCTKKNLLGLTVKRPEAIWRIFLLSRPFLKVKAAVLGAPAHAQVYISKLKWRVGQCSVIKGTVAKDF